MHNTTNIKHETNMYKYKEINLHDVNQPCVAIITSLGVACACAYGYQDGLLQFGRRGVNQLVNRHGVFVQHGRACIQLGSRVQPLICSQPPTLPTAFSVLTS